jgi:hypothetical protein
MVLEAEIYPSDGQTWSVIYAVVAHPYQNFGHLGLICLEEPICLTLVGETYFLKIFLCSPDCLLLVLIIRIKKIKNLLSIYWICDSMPPPLPFARLLLR